MTGEPLLNPDIVLRVRDGRLILAACTIDGQDWLELQRPEARRLGNSGSLLLGSRKVAAAALEAASKAGLVAREVAERRKRVEYDQADIVEEW